MGVAIATTGWGVVLSATTGLPLSGQTLVLKNLNLTTATVYSDRACTVVLPPPVLTGADGVWPGYVRPDTYQLTEPIDGTVRYVEAASGDKSRLPLNAKDYGAVGDGVTNDTAALQAWWVDVVATKQRGKLSGTAGNKFLVTDTLYSNADFPSGTGWSLEGERTERGCNADLMAGYQYSNTKILFRPADTTKWLVQVHRTTEPSRVIGPFEHRNITFDFGNANGFRFGREDLTTPGVSDVVQDGLGQSYIFGMRFDNCAFQAAYPDRNSDANGVIVRSGRKMLHLTKGFECVVEDVSMLGGDTQIRTWGCDKPLFSKIRSQGSHLPLDLNTSGGFEVQHTVENFQVEGWTFTPLRSSVDLAVSDSRFEQNDGNPSKSGAWTMPATAVVTADSDTLTFSSSMNGILFPELSIIKLVSGSNELYARVKTVSGTTVTIDASATAEAPIRVPFTAAAATVTRIHGYGPIHYGHTSATLANSSAGASLGCPAFVWMTGRGSMSISGALAEAGSYGDIRSLVIGNRLSSGGYLQGMMAFSGCSSLICGRVHPLLTVDNRRENYGQSVLLDKRAFHKRLDELMAITNRKWVFAPGAAGTSSNDAHLIPFVELAGDVNTLQRIWAWQFSVPSFMPFGDQGFPANAGTYVRIRVKWRSVNATGNARYYFSKFNVGVNEAVPSAPLTSEWSVHELIAKVPAVWQGAARGEVGIAFDAGLGDPYYLAGMTVEELPAMGATVASAANLELIGDFEVVTVTGTSGITSMSASYPGKRVTLVFAGALTVTDGSNLRLNGNFVTTVDDTLTLVCDGTNWYETGRSVN